MIKWRKQFPNASKLKNCNKSMQNTMSDIRKKIYDKKREEKVKEKRVNKVYGMEEI
jgi:hypothetical protein